MLTWHRMVKATLVCILAWAALILGVKSCAAQGDVDDWCITRTWCNGPSHTVLTVGSATVLDLTTPLDADEARWIPVAFYVGKEVRDHIRWSDLSWSDTATDLGFVALGWWLSGEVNDLLH